LAYFAAVGCRRKRVRSDLPRQVEWRPGTGSEHSVRLAPREAYGAAHGPRWDAAESAKRIGLRLLAVSVKAASRAARVVWDRDP